MDAPGWLLPIAAVMCYSLPILILYLSGDLERDMYERARDGVDLKQRAVADFVGWLKRVGLVAEQPARSELGCAHAAAHVLRFAAGRSLTPVASARSQAAEQPARRDHDGGGGRRSPGECGAGVAAQP